MSDSAIHAHHLVDPSKAALIKSTPISGKMARPEDCDLVFYHGSGCPDGFTAAFAAWLARGDKAEYIAMEHNSSAGPPTLPPLKGRHVVVVDYCFSRQLTESIAAEAASFIVLDHHASALKDLDGLDDSLKVFEMGQSGATLAWDYFHPSTPAPLFVRMIEDKDIWRWAYRGSEAFSAAFGSVKFDFADFKALLDKGEAGVADLVAKGGAILDYKNQVRDSHVKRAIPCVLKAAPQFRGLIVNGSTQASEIGNAMCQVPGVQFGAIFSHDMAKGTIYVSLRSDSDEVDVSVIAKGMGGGGHRRAAGFTIPAGKGIDDILVLPCPPAPEAK
jgi:uncharacterized protein